MIRHSTPDDSQKINELLKNSQLPVVDFENENVRFFVFEENHSLMACIGWEKHEHYALIRSLAVEQIHQHKLIGTMLLKMILETLKGEDITHAYLLTTTASHFFMKFGFKECSRCSMPEALKESQQVKGTCCASAMLMMKDLKHC